MTLLLLTAFGLWVCLDVCLDHPRAFDCCPKWWVVLFVVGILYDYRRGTWL